MAHPICAPARHREASPDGERRSLPLDLAVLSEKALVEFDAMKDMQRALLSARQLLQRAGEPHTDAQRADKAAMLDLLRKQFDVCVRFARTTRDLMAAFRKASPRP